MLEELDLSLVRKRLQIMDKTGVSVREGFRVPDAGWMAQALPSTC